MALEQERGPAPLKAIHLIFEAADGQATKVTLTPEGGLYHAISSLSPNVTQRSVDHLVAAQEEAPPVAPTPQASESTTSTEKSPTTVLPGKLQTKPKAGNPDRHGKPTAWAQFLAHVEGREGATLLSTSFHGRTREIALQLHAGDHITAQGYLHLRPEDSVSPRLSTFSVIHLVHYPNKPVKNGEPPA